MLQRLGCFDGGLTEARLKELEETVTDIQGVIVDLRRQINRLRKAPAIYTTFPEYDREEPTGS